MCWWPPFSSAAHEAAWCICPPARAGAMPGEARSTTAAAASTSPRRSRRSRSICVTVPTCPSSRPSPVYPPDRLATRSARASFRREHRLDMNSEVQEEEQNVGTLSIRRVDRGRGRFDHGGGSRPGSRNHLLREQRLGIGLQRLRARHHYDSLVHLHSGQRSYLRAGRSAASRERGYVGSAAHP